MVDNEAEVGVEDTGAVEIGRTDVVDGLFCRDDTTPTLLVGEGAEPATRRPELATG